MGKRKGSKKGNYLDYVPVPNIACDWEQDEDGRVTIHAKNEGFYAGIAGRFFKRPRVSHISLDEMGSFVWLLMDGERNIYEIAGQVGEKFGSRADPLYTRLAGFFKILYRNHFIGYKTE